GGDVPAPADFGTLYPLNSTTVGTSTRWRTLGSARHLVINSAVNEPADRGAAGCAQHGALRPCLPPLATVCDRRWCSTARGPSSRRSGRRFGRPTPWQRSSAGRGCAA